MKSSAVHRLHDDIAIVGWACRLPGANSVDELWSLLLEGRCAVSSVPEDRFTLDRFGHPRRQEKGKSYTWAAGVLDDIWGFDPSVFGISPREAVQIDPQQRILLQLTWEALEDAGIPPSSIANSEVGVFVGASQTDYGHAFFNDPAIADAHFAPGTALAILANRISYIYGVHGPSVTVDTACSSSLVALHQAVEALRSGRIDTAIVGGSNLIASPASFIAFSQANMLSPTGLCQAFSAAADGFVRAEGATVLVLRHATLAAARRNPVHGLVLASDVNSDGRTNGISLPNVEAQEGLLHRVYEHNNIDPERLAFVEAHGTGTPVGDPVEATAIGRSIGMKRSRPLPIGSIKTNIGHLEPASGLAGLLKAVLALNHGLLPPSLHFAEPNPHIDFDALNVSVCTQPLLLPEGAEEYAGVNSFGFGGTNAHVVVAGGRKAPPPATDGAEGRQVFTLSANSSASLRALAREYGDRIDEQPDVDTAVVASAIVHRRERQSNRLAILSTRTAEVTGALDAFLAGMDHPQLMVGTAVGREMPVAFVYSGNGGQWVGMGRAAYRNNPTFRSRFELTDSYFKEIGGWSLREALFSDELEERLPLTSVAQPLIFGIQSASTAALRDAGLQPAAVLGHSVGEVGAAEAAGVLDLRTAIKVIHFRSLHQESVHGSGRMAAVLTPPDKAEELVDEVDGVEIAAINSPRMVTVAGPTDAVATFRAIAKKRGVAFLDLGLDYPFHTALMDSLEEPLEADLRDMQAHDAGTPFISTVTGACMPGSRLDARYWWRNVREPVRFMAAIRAAAELGARYFVEVGPRATLLQHIMDSLQGEANGCATYAALDRSDADHDPFAKARAHAFVTGARIDMDRVFGPDPGPGVALPTYPWEQTEFRFKPTVEALGSEPGHDPYPLAGTRSRSDALDWRSHVDTDLHPALADHRLGEQTIFPGTGFIEIVLEVAQRWMEADSVTLSGFEILNPLDLTSDETREIMTRVSPESNLVEVLSRPRLSQVSWLLHCRTKLQANSGGGAPAFDLTESGRPMTPATLYGIAEASGLPYGPAFRLVRNVVIHDNGVIDVELTPADGSTPFSLDPMRLDACGHGMFTLFPELRAVERGVTYIPVRLDEISLLRSHVPPVRCVIEITSRSDRFIVGNSYVYGPDDGLVAVLRGVRSQAVRMRRTNSVEGVAFVERPQLVDGTILADTGVDTDAEALVEAATTLGILAEDAETPSEPEMLVEGWAAAAAYEIASAVAEGGIVDIDALVAHGRIAEGLRGWLRNVLVSLEAAGLATGDGASWTLTHDPSLPKASAVVNALAGEQQEHVGEMLVAAAVADITRQLVDAAATDEIAMPRVALDFYNTADVALREWSDALYRLLMADRRLWPGDRALRVLQVGFSPLAHLLLGSPHEIRLTIFEPDRRRHGSAEVALSRNRDVRLVGAEQADALGEYDLIVAVSGLHRLAGNVGVVDLVRNLAPGGLMVAFEPAPSLFRDLVLGLDPDWFSPGAGDRPVSRLRSPSRWRSELEAAGFAGVRALAARSGSELACFIVAEGEAEAVPGDAELEAPGDERTVFVVAPGGESEIVDHLVTRLSDAGSPPSVVRGASEWPALSPDVVVYVPELAEDPGDPVAALTRRCLDIKACAERLGEGAATLWLVFSGALVDETSPVRPLETGAWAFSRTLANEFPKMDVRRIDIPSHVPSRVAAERIHGIVSAHGSETELHVGEKAVRAVRVTGLRKVLDSEPAAKRVPARLKRRSSSGQRLSWEPAERRRPGPGEVEIEVEATGLNFRDVMWSLSLLPEDMLEDGFSGPTLGLECAGGSPGSVRRWRVS